LTFLLNILFVIYMYNITCKFRFSSAIDVAYIFQRAFCEITQRIFIDLIARSRCIRKFSWY